MIWLPASGAAAGVLLAGLSLAPAARAQSGKSGDLVVTSQEIDRRMQQADNARRLIEEGDALSKARNDCDAADKYREAAQLLLPGAPATAEVRAEAVRKFSVSGVRCARELAANGDYDKAEARLNQILADNMAPRDAAALKLKEHLKDADRHNPALTPRHVADIKKVSRLLTMAEGYVNIGDFNTARHAYNQVLAVDPTNSAARRGLERVENLIEEYLKSARDHTRIKMLNDVDRLWETKIPYLSGIRPVAGGGPEDISVSGSTVASKLRSIVIPRLAMTEASITEAISYLTKKSIELDTSTDESRRGVNIIWNPGTGGEAATRPVTLDMRNVTLGDALRAVCEVSGTRFSSDGAVVRISLTGSGALETRRFRVPPGFLATAATATSSDTTAADPFATGAAEEAKPKLGRLDPKTFLEQRGIQFPEGARAGYSSSENLLTVINTPENLDIISQFVEGLTTTSQRQAQIKVILLKCSEQRLEELGGEFFLEPFKAGGGVFASGGTLGNSELGGGGNSPGNFGNNTFLPVQVPFNVVQGPVTAGLRSSFELSRTQSIDDLINITSSGLASSTQTRSPYITGVAGIFTDPRFQALVRGLHQKKGIDLSVANRVTVKSGQRAMSFSGRDFLYPTEFDPPQIPQTVVAPQIIVFDPFTGIVFVITLPLAQPPVTPATPTSFEKKEVGSNIEVEATIGDDGYTVDLNLAVSFSEFDGFINYGTPIKAMDTPVILTENKIIQPVFSRAAATAQVAIYDGQTVAIGGLSEAKTEMVEDKVPGWSSIPIIGRFFKTKLTRTSRTAVIYFVTVDIIDPAGEKAHGSDTLNAGSASPEPAGPDSILEPGLQVEPGK